MRILLKTLVEQPLEKVYEGFDQELFMALKPPGMALKILKFEGCEAGDVVSLELNFGLFKQNWTSVITNNFVSEEEIYFIDEAEGKDLPFFLKKWKHKHLMQRSGAGTLIVDEIDYQSPFGLNLLMYPPMWLQFAWRRPVYKKYFRAGSVERQ